jgi:DNA helicase-2/ATP-dependent DNA helicase PcrA
MNPTPSQNEVITSKAATVVALSTAGSGKTTTMVRRYMHVGGKTAIITFTNAGARAIKQRIAAAGGELPWFTGTLHAFCLYILTTAGRRVTVLDEKTAEEILAASALECHCMTPAKKLRPMVTNGKATGKDKIAILRYIRALRMEQSTDYDLLLLDALDAIKAGHGPEFHHLMVDESQDSASIDGDIYRALNCKIRTIVGDDDQRIFSFRGSDPKTLKSFLADAHIVKMQENFRSDRAICAAAQNVIGKDRSRVPKQILSMTGGEGRVTMLDGAPFSDASSETAAIVARVRAELEADKKRTVAVLCRYNRTRMDITAALRAARLMPEPVAKFPRDWQHAILTLQAWGDPANGITTKAWLASTYGKEKAASIMAAASQARVAPETGLAGLSLRAVMEKAGLSRDARQRILSAADGSESAGFILLALREDAAEDEGDGCRVSVLTCHGAKGLEFDTVIIAAFEDEIFKPWDDEERRLAFVAMTRARNTLYFSCARNRPAPWSGGPPQPATPSQFITDAIKP